MYFLKVKILAAKPRAEKTGNVLVLVVRKANINKSLFGKQLRPTFIWSSTNLVYYSLKQEINLFDYKPLLHSLIYRRICMYALTTKALSLLVEVVFFKYLTIKKRERYQRNVDV